MRKPRTSTIKLEDGIEEVMSILMSEMSEGARFPVLISGNNLPAQIVQENIVLEQALKVASDSSEVNSGIPINVYATSDMQKQKDEIDQAWGSASDKKLADGDGVATLGDMYAMHRKLNWSDRQAPAMDIIGSWLGVSADKVSIINQSIPKLMVSLLRYTISVLIDDKNAPWKFVEVSTRIGKSDFSIPSGIDSMVTIQIAPKKSVSVPSTPCLGLVNRKTGKHEAIVHVDDTWRGVGLSVFGSNKQSVVKVSDWLKEQMKRLNFFKGSTIDGRAQFLDIPDTTWNDIILAPGVRERVETNIIDMFEKEPIYTANGIPAKTGFVLTGPPGTGKTTLAKILASQLEDVTFMWIVPSAVQYGSESIADIYDMAQELAPTIIFFEDADIFMAQRGGLETNGGVLTELMNRLDGVVPLKGVVTGISSNRPEVLESALINRPGRFDLKIYLGAPDVHGRAELIRRKMAKTNFEMRTADDIAELDGMIGLTPCEVNEIGRRAIMYAIEDERLDEHQRANVNKKDFEKALSEYIGEKKMQGDFLTDPFNGSGGDQADSNIKSESSDKALDDQSGAVAVQKIMLGEATGNALLESADAEKVKSIIMVAMKDVETDPDKLFAMELAENDLMDTMANMLEDQVTRRNLRRAGVRSRGINAAKRILNDDDVTVNDVAQMLTGES